MVEFTDIMFKENLHDNQAIYWLLIRIPSYRNTIYGYRDKDPRWSGEDAPNALIGI